MTEFQKRIYEVVKKIPRGKVLTYKEVARLAGNPLAYRAVGNALNKNPFAPEVPCHRVIRSDGKIGGYACGTTEKVRILRNEGYLKNVI
ncbi:MAG: MGMT family protein [Parcubacteria group bacterium]|nr:MGMT family protein [Parcubacteria group bacterium]